ncbi:MAG: cbb3-type cytochrome c oxidase subunit I [Candidatus Didemnitutus sp.]|nr:cbb3-type cytochrome c oxidase subunit I [Candidatus Didemnitutus sp.]
MPPHLASLTHGSPVPETRVFPRSVAASRTSVSVARVWFLFAVGSLVLAGLLSLLLVVGRLPFLGAIFTDPLFFKRALVVHVDLALVVWFQAGTAAFLALALGDALPRKLVGISFAFCSAGIFGLLAGAVMPGAQPILSNYVPVIDHPVFLAGLASWFVGTAIFFIGALTSPNSRITGLPDDVIVALRVAAAGNVIAFFTFAAAWRTTLAGLPPIGFYELVAWGGGHVLQAANVAMMLGLWLLLLNRWSGKSVLSPAACRWLFTALILPHAALPFLALGGTSNPLYTETATELMRWTLFPVILIVLGLGIRHYVIHRRSPDVARTDFRLVGLAGSVSLIVMGLIMGAMIRGSNTLVPGHYHAAIGAVTLALMAAAYDFCAAVSPVGAAAQAWKKARAQLIIFGAGQAVFALGFAIAGVYGLGRKQYGVEQHVRTTGEYVGLGVMGFGGILAVAGGLLFLAIMLRCIGSWRARSLPQT